MVVFNTKTTIHHFPTKKTYSAGTSTCNLNIFTESICKAAYRPSVHIHYNL